MNQRLIGIIGLALFAGALGSRAALADEAVCNTACNKRAPSDNRTIVIDGNTGERISGGEEFPQGTQIKVVIRHKNPFKYVYRVETTVTPLEQAISLAFLKLIPGFPDLSGAVPEKLLKAVPGDGAELPTCTGPAVGAFLALSTAASGDFAKQASALMMAAKEPLDSAKAYEDFRTETDKDLLVADDSLNAGCGTICANASSLQAKLPALIDLGTLPADAKKVKTGLDKVTGALKAFDEALSQPASSCDDDAKKAVAEIRTLSTKTAKAIEAVSKLENSKAGYEAAKKLLDAVLADESAFEEVFRPFVPDSPSNVQVTIYRKNLREESAKEKLIVSIPIHVGKSRLSISAGFGFSTIGETQIGRVAASVPNGSGGTKPGNVFGYTSESEFRPAVMVALNGVLKQWDTRKAGRIGLAATSGIVTTGSADDRKIDYLLGLSAALLDDQLFVTLAFHAAEIKDFAKPHKLGDPVADDLKDPLPTSKKWAKGCFFGVTYRIR